MALHDFSRLDSSWGGKRRRGSAGASPSRNHERLFPEWPCTTSRLDSWWGGTRTRGSAGASPFRNHERLLSSMYRSYGVCRPGSQHPRPPPPAPAARNASQNRPILLSVGAGHRAKWPGTISGRDASWGGERTSGSAGIRRAQSSDFGELPSGLSLRVEESRAEPRPGAKGLAGYQGAGQRRNR